MNHFTSPSSSKVPQPRHRASPERAAGDPVPEFPRRRKTSPFPPLRRYREAPHGARAGSLQGSGMG